MPLTVPLLIIAITDHAMSWFSLSSNLRQAIWCSCLSSNKAWRSVLDDWTQQSQWWYERYLQTINEEIDPHLHEYFEHLQQRGAFSVFRWKQDGAPAHRRIIVEERLRELFNHRVIALNYDPEWSPRSPDLTPCAFFFLWWYLTSKVFKTRPRDCLRHCMSRDINDLRGRIITEVDALRMLRRQRVIIRNVYQGMRAWSEACVWRNDGHAEGRCQRNN